MDKLRVFDFSFTLARPYTFWAGLIGGAFLTTASHGTDQLIVQRLLAARNQRQSVTALLIQRHRHLLPVCIVPARRRDAVGLLRRAVGNLRQG